MISDQRMIVYRFFELPIIRQIHIIRDFSLIEDIASWENLKETRKQFFSEIFKQNRLSELSDRLSLEYAEIYS